MSAFPLPSSGFDRLVADLRDRVGSMGASGKATRDSGTFRPPARASAGTECENPEIAIDPTMTGRTDEELLVAYRDGEASAFTALVERYRNDLVGFLQRFLGSRAAADDVFQDAFLQVHLSAESFDASRRFKPWLYTIAANKARDFHRRRRRRSAVSLSTPIGTQDGRETSLVDLLAGDDDEVDTGLLGSGEMTETHGYLGLRRMLDRPDPPTAVLCASMLQAIGARRALDDAGLRMGRDVSIVIHDDMPSYLRNGDALPLFTALRSSVRKAGERCAEILLEKIATGDQTPTRELWESELMLGRSTARAPHLLDTER